jgi:hypothetical protein
MSLYLIVAHQTAQSPELQDKVAALVAEDPAAEFAILVPEQDLTSSWEGEGEGVDIAQQRAEAARDHLEQKTGARVVRTTVGISDPLKAIEQELVGHHDYSSIIICTLPRGASRWLKRDLVGSARKRFALPVIHVVGHGARV